MKEIIVRQLQLPVSGTGFGGWLRAGWGQPCSAGWGIAVPFGPRRSLREAGVPVSMVSHPQRAWCLRQGITEFCFPSTDGLLIGFMVVHMDSGQVVESAGPKRTEFQKTMITFLLRLVCSTYFLDRQAVSITHTPLTGMKRQKQQDGSGLLAAPPELRVVMGET